MTALPPVDGIMFDLDGTLILSDRKLGQYRPLPGAAELLHELDRRGIPFVAMTNGSAYPAAEQGPKLRAVGLPVPDARLFTPNSVAVGLFRTAGFERVMVLGTDGVARALSEGGIGTVAPGSGKADAVYVAWHPQCTMDDIHAACDAVVAGAPLFTASDVPFFATSSGRAFGYSCAIAGAIARVTGREPVVAGKPSLQTLRFVAEQLGIRPERLAVVGDDPRVEIEMARAGGAIGIGVTTGTTSRAEWSEAPAERRPHLVIDSLAELHALLGERVAIAS
jgi:HAD superfamily hydrolase (TIGR01450 family)